MPATGRRSLYGTIKKDIISAIKDHSLNSGDKLPTENELMGKYNVSRITVSKAMSELKDEGYIVRFPSRGSFVSNVLPDIAEEVSEQSEEEIPEQEVKEIGLVMPKLIGQFSLNLIHGIQQALPKEWYHLSIFPSYDCNIEPQVLERCREIGCSGLILFPVDQEYYSEQVLKMKVEHYPFVLIDRILPGIDTNYVMLDNFTAGRMIGRHLKEMGHQRIGFCTSTGKETFTVHERLEGCRYEFISGDHDRNSITVMEKIDTAQDSSLFLPKFEEMITENRITAIISIESDVGAYLFSILQKLGYEVPTDMSVVCFDAPMGHLPGFDYFTHIAQQEEEVGYRSGLILRGILEEKRSEISRMVLTPHLEIRKSTGAAPGR